jgi:hypothetical protein
MSIDKEIEADSYGEAKAKALAIDPNWVGPEEMTFGDIVDDVVTIMDGDQIGCNGVPFCDNEKEVGNG